MTHSRPKGHFGVVSGSFWGRFGVVSGSFWGRVGSLKMSISSRFGVVLGSFRGCHRTITFASVWGRFGVNFGGRSWVVLGSFWGRFGAAFLHVVFPSSLFPAFRPKKVGTVIKRLKAKLAQKNRTLVEPRLPRAVRLPSPLAPGLQASHGPSLGRKCELSKNGSKFLAAMAVNVNPPQKKKA